VTFLRKTDHQSPTGSSLPPEFILTTSSLFSCLFVTALFVPGQITKRTQLPQPAAPQHLTEIAPPPLPLDYIVHAAALEHNVDPAVIKSIIKAESGFRPDAASPKGALGLMQVMPETAEELGYDATIPEQNIQAGIEYLGSLVSRYSHRRNGLQLAIAAYNAGPGNVDKYRGIPPFPETRSYVKRVMAYYNDFRRHDGERRGVLQTARDTRPRRILISLMLL
jgi:soluble lytic murein transglycosylase-like protein